MTTTTTDTDRRDPFDLLGLAVLNTAWYVLIGAAVALRWALLFPVISVPVVLSLTAGVLLGWPVGAVSAVTFTAGLLLWQRKRPELFARWVTRRARARFLTWWRYRRRWVRLMRACGLAVLFDDRTMIPHLLSVEIGETCDRVRVRMLEGQCPADYDNRTDRLAHAFRAQQCRAVLAGPGIYELTFRYSDALADTIVLPRVDHWTKPAEHREEAA